MTYIEICYIFIIVSMCPSAYLPICLSAYLPIYLSVYRSIYLSIYLSVYLSIYLILFIDSKVYVGIPISGYPLIYGTAQNRSHPFFWGSYTQVSLNFFQISCRIWMMNYAGWWFGTFFIFPYIGNNHPN